MNTAPFRFQRQDGRGGRIDCLVIAIGQRQAVIHDGYWPSLPAGLIDQLFQQSGGWTGNDGDALRYTRDEVATLTDEQYAALKPHATPWLLPIRMCTTN